MSLPKEDDFMVGMKMLVPPQSAQVFFVDMNIEAGESTLKDLTAAGHAVADVAFQRCDVTVEQEIVRKKFNLLVHNIQIPVQ